ncbi:MAG: SurA N-terminal domain-containing protein [Puniceicoccales bacterium]|jgi:peptidyl-prolyl cis-trans isomerase D|nr:SurA N-terminal domain-containing protein [Puniceicoccales bacterium]
MISFLQNILQKHHKCLFGILLFVIIVAFVFTIGASPGIGRAKTKRIYFYGQDLSNALEMSKIAENVAFSASFEKIDSNVVRSNLNQLILRRITALGLAEEYSIPNPSPDKLKRYIKTLPICLDEKGKFSPDLYTSILEMFKQNGFGQERLSQILCENCRIEEMENILAGNGIAFGEQIREYLAKQDTEYDFAAAVIERGDIKVDEYVGDVAMENFYREHPGRYLQPRMHAVSMVKFESKDFLEAVKDPEELDLVTFFQRNKDDFGESANFEKVKKAVREAYVNAEATKMAYVTAENFAGELYENNVPLNSEEFERILQKFALKKEKIAVYSKKKLPSVNGIAATYLRNVCDLESDRYYTDPCPATFGCVILFLEGTRESRELTFDEAKPSIRDDIIQEKKMAKFANKIEQIRQEVVATIGSGKDIYAMLRKNDVKHETFKGISLRNADANNLDGLYKSAIASLGSGERIKLMALSDEEVLMFVIVETKKPEAGTVPGKQFFEAESLLKSFNRNFVLFNFFENQAAGAHL